ncbi:UNVERIFIED_CONTAM: phage tail length tape measure family protein [Methylobacteriaceae bacterium AG10]|nr:phage tail length tape measure family protein [Methylobacteriaceae bacterium AG10]
MVSLNTIRSATVRYISEGADKMRQDAEAVAASQNRMGQAATQAAAATERASATMTSAANEASAATARANDASTKVIERQAQITEQAQRRQLYGYRTYVSEIGRLDPAERARQQLERSESIINRAFRQDIIDAQERNLRLEQAQRRYGITQDNEPGAVRRGLDVNQRRDLMYQGGDVVASLGSGAGIGTVAFQQGPQILQGLAAGEGGLRGGLKALGESALGLITPFSLATTAVVGATAAFGLAAKQASDDRTLLERSTQGLGRGTGATVGDLDALAKANAELGKVSTSTAREIVAGYASTGQIAIPVIGDLTRVTSEYARLVGSDVPSATSELARAFSDPARFAEDLASKIGGLSDRTMQLIQIQVEQGDKSLAQQTLAESLKATIDANANATTGWAAAWNAAATAAGNYWEAAKRIAGIKLGVAPEGAQEALDRLNGEIEKTNRIRQFSGLQPLGLGDKQVRERDAAAILADSERRQKEFEAAQERADKASRAAGSIARSVDPNYGRLSTLRTQQSELRDALADPLTRGKLGDFGQTESAYLSVTRAVESLTDANGKLISSEELSRRQDQLRIDTINAKTAAEKASVAERQKAFDLIGKTIEPGDARGQISRAGLIARAEEAGGDKKGAGSGEKMDDFDRALRSADDRMRRQQQEAMTYGMGAEAVARYRTETDLLTAAKRAERDITPDLTAQIQSYTDRAGAAAAQQEKLRESMRDMDELRGAGRDTFGGMFRDLARGTSAADAFTNALGRIQDRIASLAADSLAEALFGKHGSSEAGLFSGLLGGGSGGGIGGFFSSLLGGGASADTGVGLTSDGGWSSGGYTGAGGRLEPAGIVHRGEVVWSQRDVARVGGVAVAEAIRRGLPGYSTGGPVGAPAWMPPPANAAGGGSTPVQVVINNVPADHTASATMTNGPQGPRLEVQLEKMLDGMIADGRLDKSLGRRFGARSVGR